MGVAPDQPPPQRLGVGIDQELVRIEPVPALGSVGPVYAIAVWLTGRHIVEIAVPHVVGMFGQCDALDLAMAELVEQTKLDFLGVGGEQRKVGSTPIPGGAEGMRGARREPHTSAAGREKWQPGAEQQG